VTSDVTVVVPSHRSAGTLDACLGALRAQETRRGYEVVVVHSGPEPVAGETARRFPDVRFSCRPETWLPGRARNWAIRSATSPWLLFIDSDCVARPDWLERMVAGAERADLDGLGGAVANGSPESRLAWCMHVLEFGEWLPAPGPCRPSDNFPSCNALYRRQALLAVGGFPEDVFPCEDTMLNVRLRQEGRRLGWMPGAIVAHVHTRTPAEARRHSYQLGRTYRVACERYPMPGAFLRQLPAWLALPAIVGGRLVKVAGRLARRRPRVALRFLAGAPTALWLLVAWGRGFTAR
jgi:GT2 family glycosyltransferase